MTALTRRAAKRRIRASANRAEHEHDGAIRLSDSHTSLPGRASCTWFVPSAALISERGRGRGTRVPGGSRRVYSVASSPGLGRPAVGQRNSKLFPTSMNMAADGANREAELASDLGVRECFDVTKDDGCSMWGRKVI